MNNKYIHVPAPKEHQRRTGEPTITKTLIKRCTKCHRFKPHWTYLETKSLDGLGTTCNTCRRKAYEARADAETEDQRDARLNYMYEYYDDNPLYYKWTAKARYLEKKAQTMLEKEAQRKEWHKRLYPDAPYYSSSERWAQEYLLEAKKLRRKAGKPKGK